MDESDPRSARRGMVSGLGELEAERFLALLGDLGRAAAVQRFDVAPNPCVGAAVLSDGVEIGRGLHRAFGGPHAEIQALEAAASSGIPRERWDTLVVTLEPCSSTGKTPPCTEALLREKLQRVVVGALDPDPRQRGQGLEELRARGIEVLLLQGAAPLEKVSPHFVEWTRPDRLRRPRPWLIAKWAQTRTGQLSPPDHAPGDAPGDAPRHRWISGEEARAEVQVLRGRVDAILTGVGTVLADDPRLSVRPPGLTARPPWRVVLDSELRTPPEARLFERLPEPLGAGEGETEAAGPVHIFARAGFDPVRYRALAAAGAIVHALHPGDDGRASLRECLGLLWTSGIRRLLLEGGPTLLEAAFASELVDQVRVYSADVNGGRGPSLARWLAPERLAQVAQAEVGRDSRLDAFVRR